MNQLNSGRTPQDGWQRGDDGDEPETVDLKVTKVMQETKKAVRVVVDGTPYWLPRSQIVSQDGKLWTVYLWWVKQANVRGYV